jgi:hypothetical protein
MYNPTFSFPQDGNQKGEGEERTSNKPIRKGRANLRMCLEREEPLLAQDEFHNQKRSDVRAGSRGEMISIKERASEYPYTKETTGKRPKAGFEKRCEDPKTKTGSKVRLREIALA